MSSVTLSQMLTTGFVSTDFDGTTFNGMNVKQTYGTDSTTIDVVLTWSADVSIDAIAIPAISQATGLTFDLDFKNSGGTSITTESISQTVETYARSTSHQILDFTQVDLVRTIELQITGVSGDIVFGGFYPYLTSITPTHNFNNGAKFQQNTERRISESQTFSYGRYISKLRTFNLPFSLLTEAEINEISQFDSAAGDYPVLVRLDPAEDSAYQWMVGNINIGDVTIDSFNQLSVNFMELRAWQ